MSLFLTHVTNKPNRLDTKKYPDKDNNPQYHVDYGKYVASVGLSGIHQTWLKNIERNKRFFKGDQWEGQEDLTTFLNDRTGQARNRLAMVVNQIRPLVEQFRGNAARLKINASANSVSKLAINRREERLAEQLFKTKVANEFPSVGKLMQESDDTIGENEEETTSIFENLYVDKHVQKINMLMIYASKLNELENSQIKVAQDLALTGLCVKECVQHSGEIRYTDVEPEDFFWDRDSRKFDLTDASYMGKATPMDPAAIFEIWQPKGKDAEVIENYVSNAHSHEQQSNRMRRHSNNRLMVYSSYWKDVERYEYGYVKDDFGYPELVRINFSPKQGEEPEFTDKDLISPPDNPRNKRLFKGEKKRRMYVDILRYCVFIPGDILSSDQDLKERESNDVVLEYGVVPYQETDLQNLSNVKFPFKAHTWGYVDGEVFSPIDDAIDPQRFINRIVSATESQINNSGGTNVIIDEDSIDPGSKDDIYRDIAEGKPITVRTKGKGVPNTVGYYDATAKQGTYKMFEIVPMIKSFIQETTGVNEGLKGESTGSDQLVGVTQLLIQRGSLMQEPFYNAVTNLYIQIYQHMASVGKRYYTDQERELSIIAGDDAVEMFKLTKDIKNEDFKVFIERENDPETLKTQANQVLQIMKDQGLVDDITYINLYNRSTPNEVTEALRKSMKLRVEKERKEAKMQQQQQAQEQQAMQQAQAEEQQMAMQQQQRQEQKERGDKLEDQQHDKDMLALKGLIDNENSNKF